MEKLQFKFLDDTGEESRMRIVEELLTRGARVARPLFPDSKDARLALLYIVEASDKATTRSLKKILRESDEVEFVEEEVRRKSI